MKNIDEDYFNKLIRNQISKQEFLNCIEIREEDLEDQILEYLNFSYNKKSSFDIEFGIYLLFKFKVYGNIHVDILIKLMQEEWHNQHENIASLFQKLKNVKTVECLYITVFKKFDYLLFDENYALAVKCIWALGDIRNDNAISKLQLLMESDNDVVKINAKKQLDRILSA